jgi:hypothetical protein
LRETGIPIGLLINNVSLRLVYAPKGESSGYLTFDFRYLVETHGRPMAGALAALLAVERVTDLLPAAQRLPALLEESRKYQNDVSTALAEQELRLSRTGLGAFSCRYGSVAKRRQYDSNGA